MPKRRPEKDDSERWMISYADLLTLMLAFFIVLYSQSQLNVSRLKEIAKGMIVAFHGDPAVMTHDGQGGRGILKHHSSPVPKPVPSPMTPHMDRQTAHKLDLEAKALNRAEKALKKVLHPLLKSQQVTLSKKPLSLRVRLNSRILYPSGEAALTTPAKNLLTRISGVIDQIPHDYPVVIEGYTNSRPIHTARFPSNWELSAARAVSVVHLFMRNGLPGKQLSAQGFSKYRPLKSNHTASGLRANRRVEILIKAPFARSLVAKADVEQAAKAASGPAPGNGESTKPASTPSSETKPMPASTDKDVADGQP